MGRTKFLWVALGALFCVWASGLAMAQTNPVLPVPHFVAFPADGRGTPLQGVHRIVCLGDSITQFGDGPKGYVGLIRSYLTALSPAHDIEVLNAGVSGNTSKDELARFGPDVLDKKPDLLTISVGVNDDWHSFYDNHPLGDGPQGVDVATYRRNVESMVSQAQKNGVRVVLLSPTVIYEDLNSPQNIKLAGYLQALRDIARSRKCIYVDLQAPFRTMIDLYRTTGGKDNLLTVDGVHMNDWGNRLMASSILTVLLSPTPRR